MNFVDWIILAVIALALCGAITAVIRGRKKNSGCSCGGDCTHCEKRCR